MKESRYDYQRLVQIKKTIAEFFVFVDFHLYCTEPDGSWGIIRR